MKFRLEKALCLHSVIFAFSLLLSLLFSYFIHSIYTSIVVKSVAYHGHILPRFLDYLRPEPEERLIFLLSSMLTCGSAFLAMLIITPDARAWTYTRSAVTNNLIYIFLALLVVIGVSRLNFGFALLDNVSTVSKRSCWYLFVSLGAAAGCLAAQYRFPGALVRYGRFGGSLVTGLLVLATTLQIAAWRLPVEGSIEPTVPWSTHLDAVVYPISQVAAGRTLLVDLPSQYGLSAELLGWLFRQTTFSLRKLSLLFAAMQLSSLTAAFYVVMRHTRSGIFRIAFCIAFLSVTFEGVLRYNGVPDPYFQYWPIRFFWPAISVLAFDAFAIRPGLIRAGVVSFCGAIGTVWNADTGLVIIASFALFLVVKWTFLQIGRSATALRKSHFEVWALFNHILIVTVTFGVVAIYFIGVADQPLHWAWLFEYQKIFYDAGLMMLPMPLGLVMPWMIVLGVYLFGSIFTVGQWVNKRFSPASDIILFISIIGYGLFVYYQGRSHMLNLVTVCWPALIVSTLLADRTVRAVCAGGLNAAHLLMPTVTLATLLFCAIPFVRTLIPLLRDARANIEAPHRIASPLVASELAFIRSHTTPGEECVILAQRQGLYYAAARLRSPIKGPGYVETLTEGDRDRQMAQIKANRFQCVFLGRGKESRLDLNINISAVLKGYVVVDQSRFHSILFLRPA